MIPQEESLLSPSLDVDGDLSTYASKNVKRIGENDLKYSNILGSSAIGKILFLLWNLNFQKV